MSLIDLRCLIIFLILSIFSPMLGFILSLFILLSRKNNLAVFIFALSISLIAYIYIPNHRTDLAKWYLIFDNIKNGNFTNYISWLLSSPDSFIYTYIYLITRLGLNKELIPFFSVMVSYFLYLWIVIKEINIKKYTIYFSCLLIFYFIFTLDFRTITLGVRQGVAISIFVFSIYRNIINKNDILSYIMAIIAISIHFMILAPILIYIISYFVNLKYQRIIIFASLLILILPINSLMINIIQFIVPHLSVGNSAILDTYTSGYWGQEYANDLSVKGQIQVFLSTLPYYLTLFIMLIYRFKTEIAKLLLLIVTFVSICSFSDTLFIRYSVLVAMLLPILLLIEFRETRSVFIFNIIKIYSGITFFIFLGVFYSARNELSFTLENYLLMNVFSLLNYNVVPF